MKQRIKVSLCLITKDEEHCLAACLASVKHLVGEIIVVDTGSADNTVQLAQLAGARVFHFIWTGNFSQARNFGLEQARGDWILVLDADEVLCPVEVEDFDQYLENKTVEGYYLQLNNYIGDGKQMTCDRVVRLFRNKPEYRFVGAIHEQVATSIIKINQGQGLVPAPLVIDHYGYLAAVISKKNKFWRNTTIIAKELRNTPQDPFLFFALALEYYQKGQIDQGLPYLERALTLMTGCEGYFEDVLLNTAIGLWHLKRWQALLDFAQKSLLMVPQHKDLLLLRGFANLALQRYPAAANDLENSIADDGSSLLPHDKILSLTGDAYNLSGEYEKAATLYFLALQRNNCFLYPLTQILDFIQKKYINWDCNRLYTFCSLEKKDSLWRELLEHHEVPLAMVILLLEIYQVSSTVETGMPLTRLTEELLTVVTQLVPLCGNTSAIEYIFIATREIDTYAFFIEQGYDCSYFMARERISILLADLLLLTMKSCSPRLATPSLTTGGDQSFPLRKEQL